MSKNLEILIFCRKNTLFRMAKAKKKSKIETASSGSNRRITLWGVGCFLLAVVAGLANKWHVETMFENDKHFSHLGKTNDPRHRFKILSRVYRT